MPICALAGAATAARLCALDREHSVLAIDTDTAQLERHVVVAVPGCPDCDPHGSSLVDSQHRDTPEETDAGAHLGMRTVDPDETFAAFAHLIGPVVGVVPFVEQIGNPAMRAFASGANVVGMHDPATAQSALRNIGGGKGLTLAAARAGALAEAIERAEKLIGGLSGERVRLIEREDLRKLRDSDIIAAAATL